MTESKRAYVYRVGLAVAAVAGIYGLASGEEIAGWVAVGTALLGNGLATANTSTAKEIGQ